MTRPCDGIRVLDFTLGTTGNLAAMVLGDYGADVLKIEPPDGDPWRDQPAWPFWNRGKRTLSLDLKSEQGRERVQMLARDADVAVVAFRPGVPERLGIGYEDLSRLNPGIIYCSITGFGPRGPFAHLKAYEGIVDARTGRMFEFGGIAARTGPGYNAVASASFGATHGALQGILAGLHRRRQTGRGALVETSMLQGNTAYDMVRWYAIQREGVDPIAKDRATSWGALQHQVPRPNYLCAVTKDGVWLQFANTMPHLFMAQMNALDLTHLYEDPRWFDLPALKDPADSEGVWEAVLERVRSKTWAEWREILDRERDMNVEPIISTQDAFDHPQVRFNGHVAEVGGTEQPGVAVTMSETPGMPGELPRSVAEGEFWRVRDGRQAERPAAVQTAAEDLERAPLEGLLVLDFATYYASPFGAALLADYGARVIKIEPPGGEYSRTAAGRLLSFKTSGGKEGLAVDLKHPEGRAILEKLVRKADILLHNFRPGVPERLGIGYEQVKALNPKIVYHYGASYGPSGPFSFKPGFHPTAGAICGNALHQMPPAAITPDDAILPLEDLKQKAWRMLQANEGNPDVNSALNVGTAMMLGLEARESHGIAQAQFTTMICANLYGNADDAIRFAGKPVRSEPDVDLYGTSALNRLYRCAGGSWVFVACPFEHDWRALGEAVGHLEWLEDPRFATSSSRAANDGPLADALADVFATAHADEWERLLSAADVACARADAGNVAQFAVEEPSNEELGFTVSVEHPTHGAYLRHGPIMMVAGTRARIGPMCEIGEHTRPILHELGYSDMEIDTLRDRGVVGCHDE